MNVLGPLLMIPMRITWLVRAPTSALFLHLYMLQHWHTMLIAHLEIVFNELWSVFPMSIIKT